MLTIVLPSDFSKNARNAIKYAIDVFGHKDVRYYIINVYREPHATSSSLVSIVDILQKTSEDSLTKEVRKVRELFPSMDLNISQASKYGDTTTQINQLCEEVKADFIIMGTKGATGLKEVLLGSVTSDVIQGCHTPLIAVPENCSFTGFDKIGFAADFKELKSDGLINPMVDLAKRFQSEVEIVTVQRPVETTNQEQAMVGLNLHELLRDVEHSFIRRESDDVIDGIESYMDEVKPDLMVLVPRKTSLWERIFKSSVTKKVALHAHVPMLALK